MAERRQLRFNSLGDAVADAEVLLARGYTRAGKWSLGQCCGHLANWLEYPVSGFPKTPLLLRPPLWAVRTLMGRKLLKKFLAEGMPPGKPTVPSSVPPADADDADGVARLRDAARRFEAHPGEYGPSPLLGPLTRDESRAVQLGHAAHHLSFLTPKH